MSDDREPSNGPGSADPGRGQVRLPGFVAPATADGLVPVPALGRGGREDRARQTRDEGLRRVRRMSNWTAAALVVGTGATAIALAHNAVPVTPPAFPGTAVSGTTTGGTSGTTAVTNGAHGPQVGHAVATTSASGVTTTTTTLPSGKTVVTHSGHATYHDN